MDISRRFVEIVAGADTDVDLGEAALLLAAHADPTLDVAAQLARLDALAAHCPEPTLDAVRRLLYVDEGFAGNVVDYYDPRNSFLDQVLDRRTGIPITLAVLAMEVGRRAGVPLVGVAMPAHFLTRHADDVDRFLDPFDGVVLDRAGCRDLYHRVAGFGTAFDESFLDPVGPKAILARMLNNLKLAYGRRHDSVALTWVLRLRLAFPDAPLDDRLELSRALRSTGRYGEAADELDELAELLPDESDELRVQAAGLRARLN